MNLVGVGGDDQRPAPVGTDLAGSGFAVRRQVVPRELVSALVDAVDRAVAIEAADFPPGDPQHGRLLCAVEHGGPFLDLAGHDALFAPLEDLVGTDAILYLMTTSVLDPGTAGPVPDFHTDLAQHRPAGLMQAAIVMLDPFSPTTGATEFRTGSHRAPGTGTVVGIEGDPGDVCYFDPQVEHRSTFNRSDHRRRAVLVALVPPWMKQRVDIPALVPADAAPGPTGRRRLGLDAVAPRSRAEFVARRSRPPWRS